MILKQYKERIKNWQKMKQGYRNFNMILKQLTKGIRIWQKMKQQYRNQHNIMNLF